MAGAAATHHDRAIDGVRDRIVALHARDAEQCPVASSIDDIPVSYEAITDDWLTAVLCRGADGARVIGHRLDVPDDGTANRRRIFVEYNRAGQAAGLPASLFCKASHDLKHRLTLGISGGAHGEVTFYRNVRPQIDLEIPTCFHADYDPASFCSIVVMDDIAPDVTFCGHEDVVTLAEARAQVRLLAAMHAHFQGSVGALKQATGLIGWTDFFANATSHGQETGSNNGFLAAGNHIPERLRKRFAEVWPATVRSVGIHETLPATVLHGDCHLKQWYRTAAGGMGLADWQCCTVGNWSRDISYVLAASLAVEDRRAWEHDLVGFYLEEMRAAGVEMPPFEEAWRLYSINMLSALNWWTGTLTPGADMADMQPRDTTLAFIARIAHAVDDLGALDIEI